MAAETARGTAAVHRGIADTDDQNTFADALDVTEVRRRQPFDADVNVACRFRPTWDLEVLPLRRATAHEHGIPWIVEQRTHARDRRVIADVHTHPKNRSDLVVEHFRRKPEGGDVDAHQSAGF